MLGSLDGFFDRFGPKSVPEASYFQELPDQGFWNLCSETMVESQSQGHPSFARQWYVVSW